MTYYLYGKSSKNQTKKEEMKNSRIVKKITALVALIVGNTDWFPSEESIGEVLVLVEDDISKDVRECLWGILAEYPSVPVACNNLLTKLLECLPDCDNEGGDHPLSTKVSPGDVAKKSPLEESDELSALFAVGLERLSTIQEEILKLRNDPEADFSTIEGVVERYVEGVYFEIDKGTPPVPCVFVPCVRKLLLSDLEYTDLLLTNLFVAINYSFNDGNIGFHIKGLRAKIKEVSGSLRGAKGLQKDAEDEVAKLKKKNQDQLGVIDDLEEACAILSETTDGFIEWAEEVLSQA